MTEKEACRILGVSALAEQSEIKKKYRRLILKVHPDSDHQDGAAFLDEAQRINQAYEVLKRKKTSSAVHAPGGAERKADAAAMDRKKGTYQSGEEDRKEGRRDEKKNRWNAPENPQAYCDRDIFYQAEDMDGSAIGHFCIARGKYLWTTDEEFSLFLLSLYQCGKNLLDEIDIDLDREEDTARKRRIQTELTYLLAQQFLDAGALLRELAVVRSDAKGQEVFYLSAMLEQKDGIPAQPEGELLYPLAIRRHRLYLKNKDGQELGYLSFSDDRLYYIVVPLFEQRRVQVRIQVKEKKTSGTGKKRSIQGGYQNLRLWLRLSEEHAGSRPENLNLRIKQLLENYRKNRMDIL